MTSRKRFSNFFFYFFNMKLSWNKFFCISKILDSEFSDWKKIHFCPEILIFFFKFLMGIWHFFLEKKGSPIFIFFLSIWSLDEIKLLKFGTFRIPIFPIGKNSDLVPKILNFWFKNTNEERPFLWVLAQKHERGKAFFSSTWASLARSVLEFHPS